MKKCWVILGILIHTTYLLGGMVSYEDVISAESAKRYAESYVASGKPFGYEMSLPAKFVYTEYDTNETHNTLWHQVVFDTGSVFITPLAKLGITLRTNYLPELPVFATIPHLVDKLPLTDSLYIMFARCFREVNKILSDTDIYPISKIVISEFNIQNAINAELIFTPSYKSYRGGYILKYDFVVDDQSINDVYGALDENMQRILRESLNIAFDETRIELFASKNISENSWDMIHAYMRWNYFTPYFDGGKFQLGVSKYEHPFDMYVKYAIDNGYKFFKLKFFKRDYTQEITPYTW